MSVQFFDTRKLRELGIEFVDGDRSSKYPKREEFLRDGIPFFNAESIKSGVPDLGKANFISWAKYDTIKKGRLQAGDVILTTRGNGVGDVAYFSGHIPYGLINAQMLILRADNKTVSSRFLYYAIRNPHFQEHIRNFASGSAQPQLPIRDLRDIALTVPPFDVQHRIASILSAYDDLIENNTQRIKALEAAAQALYREWFVEFRFPGWEQVEWVETELGSIPKGWRIANLGGITTKIGSGATPRGGKEAYNDTGISLIRSLNVYDYHFDIDGLAFIDEKQADDLSNVVVEVNDVLLNITGASVARCCMVPSWILPARVNQHVAIVRSEPSSLNPHYLLYTLNSYRNKEMLLTLAQAGATREALTKSKIEDFKIILPPVDMQNRFGEFFGEGHLIENLEQRNHTLRQTRDLLLPRLISGELSVE